MENIKVFITIDTEEDSWGERSRSQNAVENVQRLPALQELMDRYGARPTYLINYPVATNPSSIRILKELKNKGSCEIGTHCHPWNTPPFEENINDYNSMLSNLPYSLIRNKMELLHGTIAGEFGITPVSFRAGRWGFGPKVARCIRDLGYLVDSSVLPLWNWDDVHGPDFSRANPFIYRFSPEDILREREDGELIEVPVTMSFRKGPFRIMASFRRRMMHPPFSHLHLLGLLDRTGLVNLCMLCPETASATDMIRGSENFIRSGHTHLNMMFHSTSLIPGKSEFVRDQNQLEQFMDRISAFLGYCRERNFSFCTLNSAAENNDEQR